MQGLTLHNLRKQEIPAKKQHTIRKLSIVNLLIHTSGYFSNCFMTSGLTRPTWKPSTTNGLHSVEYKPTNWKYSHQKASCMGVSMINICHKNVTTVIAANINGI